MFGFCPLASGSKGNCLYLGTRTRKILIDFGISSSGVRKRLLSFGVSLEEIDAILITHEHLDHIGGLKRFSLGSSIPIICNADTAKAIYSLFGEGLQFKIFSTGETFVFGDVEIHPFSIPHDAIDPVGFTCYFEGIKLGVCADLGFVPSLVSQKLSGCDYLYVEANHQPSMVHASRRPDRYKQRVLSRQGHLSNEECAQLIEEIHHPELKHIHLAHLSSECNHPDLALKIIQERLAQLGSKAEVAIAFQEKRSREIEFQVPLRSMES